MPAKNHPDFSLVSRASAGRLQRRAIILLAVVLLAAASIVASGLHQRMSLEAIIDYRERIEAIVADHLLQSLAAYVVVYAIAAALALPGVVFLTIGGGVIFGGLLGGIAAVAGATTGATAVFLVAQAALRDFVRRWSGQHVEHFAAGFREDAFNYLLFMRLVPIFPFSMGNLLPAVCGVRLRTFVLATGLGIIPMTMAFAFLGAGLDDALGAQVADYRACLSAAGLNCRLEFSIWTALTPQLLIAIAALGAATLIPVLIKRRRVQG